MLDPYKVENDATASRHNSEEEESGEKDQVDDSLQHGSAASAQSENAYKLSGNEQD